MKRDNPEMLEMMQHNPRIIEEMRDPEMSEDSDADSDDSDVSRFLPRGGMKAGKPKRVKPAAMQIDSRRGLADLNLRKPTKASRRH